MVCGASPAVRENSNQMKSARDEQRSCGRMR
jgi:hypothetical protein